MAGANYMGGKRNTARAKSKDIIGRAQRRHFGKQRLASALCVTQEKCVHPRLIPSALTLSSVLSEITLAHARCDASTDPGATSSRKVFSGDRLYSSTLSSYTTQRNKLSKVLGALDISDHLSMRAAIDRILQQPNLIGINASKLEGTAYIERMQAHAAVRRPTDAHLDSKDLDAQHSEIVSKHVFDHHVSYPQIPGHGPMGFPETNLNTKYKPTESGILSPPDSPSGMCDVTSRDADDSGYAEAQLSTGAIPFYCTEGNGPGRPNTFLDAIYPLSRSSPIPSSSQSSDNSILDLDTSPRAAIRPGRSDDLSEDSDWVDASSLRSTHQPIFREPSRSFPIREGSTGVNEAQFTISSHNNLNGEEIKAERSRSRTTCCNDRRACPSTRNNFRHTFRSESERDSMRVLTSEEDIDDDVPSDISIDFLSDPHPWETISRILKLEPPEPFTVQYRKINFTKDREGVGYISPERSGTCNARSSDATSFETRINDQSADDIRVASSANPPIFEIAEPDGLNAADHVATDTPDSPCTNNSTRPLFDAEPPSTNRGEVDPCIHVHALQEGPSIPAIHYTPNEHPRSSSPLAAIVGITAAEPDVDMTFDGPCLFGDSDLEEDE